MDTVVATEILKEAVWLAMIDCTDRVTLPVEVAEALQYVAETFSEVEGELSSSHAAIDELAIDVKDKVRQLYETMGQANAIVASLAKNPELLGIDVPKPARAGAMISNVHELARRA